MKAIIHIRDSLSGKTDYRSTKEADTASRHVWIPTYDDVIETHDSILERTGGDTGLLHHGTIRGTLDRCQYGPFEDDPDLCTRAAYIIRGIGQEHPFVDGNKRTAFELAMEFLQRNGNPVAASTAEIVDFMLRVARIELDVVQIGDWLRAHVRQD